MCQCFSILKHTQGCLKVALANIVGAFRRKLGSVEDESTASKPTENKHNTEQLTK